MNTEREKEEIIKVPADMLMDILAIIVKEELSHEITEVLENRGIVHIAIGIDEKQPRQAKVIQNIRGLLSNYNQYRHRENQPLNWKEL